MTTATDQPQPQSAAAPSPFPPIADYAFLSNCHTAALIAPDGAVDWLCLPSFDAPSAFGSLLDRQAGFFRLGPFGINHPTARAYEPGTNVLVTTWKTPSGWIVVRDALTMGPTDHEDEITPHTRPPADDDAEHMLVRVVECLGGRVELELVCEPAFDYGRTPAQWSLVDGGRHAADATGAGQTMRLTASLPLGVEGNRVRARHVLEAGDKAYCALSWAEQLAVPADVDDAESRIAFEPEDPLTPETIYDARCALELLGRATRRLEQEETALGKAQAFCTLRLFLDEGVRASLSYEAAAQALNVGLPTLKTLIHRLCRRHTQLLREQVAQTVLDSNDVDAEAHALCEALVQAEGGCGRK